MNKKKFIEDIVSALGTRHTSNKKHDFAQYLSGELFYSINEARDREHYDRLYGEIVKTSQDVLRALKAHQSVTSEARQVFWTMNPLSWHLTDRITKNYKLEDLITHFEYYNTSLAKKNPPQKGRGRRNIISDRIAKLIAEQYLECFGSLSTGKGNFDTPYDRVCKIVEKHYSVSLSIHTRSKAVTRVKKPQE